MGRKKHAEIKRQKIETYLELKKYGCLRRKPLEKDIAEIVEEKVKKLLFSNVL